MPILLDDDIGLPKVLSDDDIGLGGAFLRPIKVPRIPSTTAGGKPLALAPAPSIGEVGQGISDTVADIASSQMQPIGPAQPSPTRGLTEQDLSTLPAAAKAGIVATKAAQGVGDVLRTPFTYETLGLGPALTEIVGAAKASAVGRAISAAFAGQMTVGAAQKAGELVTELKKPKTQQDTSKILDLSGGLVTDAAFAGATAAHAATPTASGGEMLARAIDESPVISDKDRKSAQDKLDYLNRNVNPNTLEVSQPQQNTGETQNSNSQNVNEVPVVQGGSQSGQVIPADTGQGQGVQRGRVADVDAPKENVTPTSEENTHGIANRVNEARSSRGDIEPVEPGTTLGPEDSIEAGRKAIADGVSPQQLLADFTKTKRFNAADVGVVRAEGERLAKAADQAFDEHGEKSPEYQAAKKADSDWAQAIQPIKTEWSGSGKAMQGEVDLDTGSFHALSREFSDKTGKDFSPQQSNAAKEVSGKVNVADKEAKSASEKAFTEASKPEPVDPKVKSIVDRVISALDKEADAARLRIKARVRSTSALVDPGYLADAAIIGASHIAHGLRDFGEWSKKMTEELGDKIDLKQVWEESNKHLDTRASDARVRKAIKPDDSIWSKAKPYLNQGLKFGDIVSRLATDTGKSIAEVNAELSKNKTAKRLTDEAWMKQKKARELKAGAKRWLAQQAEPKLVRAITTLPAAMFRAKVFGHGMVAFGTHAPMVAFQPRFWPEYIRDYGKMGKMLLNPVFYEMQWAELQRGENYALAQRAGLQTNPETFDDLDNPLIAKMFGNLSGAGNRGYFALKLLRQGMFDKMWDNLPETQKIPEVAAAISDGINHATGVTKARAPKGLSNILFAPRLEASRIAWLTTDPIRAVRAAADWKNASAGEKAFAINQVKEKAWVVGTALSLLLANQGILYATGSKQKINFTDPMQSDFLKFKGGGMNFSYGNPFITLARLPVRLFMLRAKGATGKLAKLIEPDESMGQEVLKYARTQLSPAASIAADIATKGDYQNRPLPKMPFSGPVLPVPKRLAKEGIKPYTYAEFITEAALPIPFEEGAREVFKYGLGMSDVQQKQAEKALTSIAVMSLTGGRLTDDYKVPANLSPR